MRGPSAQYVSLPFSNAIAFFKQKVTLPTDAWDDLWQGMHSRAFVVAGATKAELLLDFRKAVDKAISQGTTLAEFKKDFDSIVERHGWQYKGNRNWRSAMIYQTNLATAYDAGKYKAMTDPDVLSVRPYWRYMASRSANPREEHKQWYNLVLPYDDLFWETHSPRNGWGCKCGIRNLSARQLEQLQEEEKDGPYPVRTKAPEAEHYDWTNKKTGEVHQVPVGIDPGWDYNVGAATWGKRLSNQVMDEYRGMKNDAWEVLTPGNWATYGLTEQLQPDTPVASIGPKVVEPEAAVTALEKIIGGPERVYSFSAPQGIRYDLLMNAETLISHIDLNRTPYLPFLPETLTDPQEVWQRFDRHKGTGKVVLRQRIIKLLPVGRGKKGVLVICEAKDGWIEAWTMMPIIKLNYLNKQRTGQLVYRKE
jgi:hypothetical protein